MGSKDIEDICAVLHGREEIVAEVGECSAQLQEYLAARARELLASGEFAQSLEGHLPGEDTTLVLRRLSAIAGGGGSRDPAALPS